MTASIPAPSLHASPSMTSAARFQVLAGGRSLALSAVSTGLTPAAPAARRFALDALAGRFVELSGVGAAPLLSVALRFVLEAQRRGENAVWVGTSAATFYACDAVAHGIDLSALPLVLPPGAAQSRLCQPGQPESAVLQAGRAASHLLRSGAFGLVVLDLSQADKREDLMPLPLQSRLTGLAQKHGTLLLALTHKAADAASLGSLVSLHAHVGRAVPLASLPPVPPGRDWGADRPREASEPASQARMAERTEVRGVLIDITKDKRHGPGWTHCEHFRAPDGLG
ncbi:MAG: hypothetical protein U1F43_34065 [Myxococcota bacterium]